MRRAFLLAAMLVVTLSVGAAWSRACDTPVYRYAMYRWAPAPYEIYLFHDQPLTDEQLAVEAEIDRLSADPRTGANLVYTVVDVAADPEMKIVPADVKRMRQQTSDAPLPQYLIVTPLGAQIYAGSLNAKDVSALVESESRRAIVQRLESGHACVLVLLSGIKPGDDAGSATMIDDDEQTKAAEAEVSQLVDGVMSGKIELYSPPPSRLFGPGFGPPQFEQTGPPPDAASDDGGPAHEISMLRVSRTDPREQWLVRSLLALEPDLNEIVHPMVFAVYGRGRALPPYIGPGIDADNLLDVVEYVTGACSCTVKEQNPGMDLLIHQDWETTAERIAEKFGAEEGNEVQFGSDQLFPQLVIPATDTDAMLAKADSESQTSDESTVADTSPQADQTAEHSNADESTIAGAGESLITSSSAPQVTFAAAPQQGTSVTVPAPVVHYDVTAIMIAAVVVGLVILAVITALVVKPK